MSPTSIDGSLYEVFAQIPDPRARRGKVYPLAAVLTLASTAMLCGCRSLAAIAQWGRDYNHLAPQLGFSRRASDATFRTPCTSELHTLLAALPARVFEAALTRWILAQGVADLERRVVAIDGKTLRGSQGHQLPGVHLLAAYCRDVEAVIAQLAVPGKTNEHKTALELLKLIPLKGTLITGDAAFTQRDLCEAVIQGGGDYFLTVKDNQPTLEADIRAGFGPAFFPPRDEVRRATEDDQAEAHGKGHGRVETRRIRTTTRLTGYLDWPGVKQVCLLERTRRIKGETTTETVCAVTSLGPERASAKQLLAISRGHWGIENRLHWVRDMSLGEDACRVRTGEAPEILAAIRNAVLRLIRSSGLTEITATLRRHAAKPLEAMRLVMNFAPS